MGTIKRFFASRYAKSAIRYMLVATAASMVDLPLLTELSQFVHSHSDELAKILSAALIGWAGTWSTMKNRENAKVEQSTRNKVK